MLRKKQKTPVQTGRKVREQPAANVFSYYANRSPGINPQARRQEPSKLERRNLKLLIRKWVAYAPSLAAGFILLVCVVYASTLSSDAKLQVLGDQQKTGLRLGPDTYESQVREVFSESLLNRSKLLIDTDKIAAKLQEKYPELGEVAVILPLAGRRPVVQIRPAEPALLLGTLEGGLVVDENGRTMADARQVESSIRDALPLLQDESGLSVERGSYALPKETVVFVRIVAAQLQHKKLKIQTMSLPTVANEMHVRVEGKNYFVKFDLRGEGRAQAGTYLATKEKLEKDGKTPKEYIDVRLPGKVYYK